ncbi:hypothetical protein [Aquimarina sp. RZ0]|uniref:hypothetical protein n=1 Tax=Aquimarina sp. RZ0 TaxID=2607730 RepID=UPI0011F380C4|nr:hypothetical protein [Aquimarina sp. RZ0]KAA1243735.1 hypothetical protein F0000_19790 [Aquimarina sp. RZ0]
MKKTVFSIFKKAIILIFVGILCYSCEQKIEVKEEIVYAETVEPQRASYLNFPTPLSPDTPWDIDPVLKKQLDAQNKPAEVQRLFEILSWQWFIALNWPTDDTGKPKSKIEDAGNPRWFEWKESYEVFLPNGQKPAPWGVFTPPAHFPKPDTYAGEKLLFRTNKFVDFEHPDIEDEVNQAFTSPIWDQNGNITRYEIRMNKVEFEYVVQNELYNYDGQIVFAKNQGNVKFPEGNPKKEGAIEIKIAWKILTDTDIESRYFTTDGYVINADGTYTKRKVGMVGMHISSKTKSSPQWIWTTYEQVDNLEVNLLDTIDGKPLRPSYNDPNCAICPINVLPDTIISATNPKIKTQIQRVIPISGATEELNANVQSLLKAAKSKLQYYQQIGTQWPTAPEAPPYTLKDTTTYTLPQSVTNKSGGNPTPTYLTNMIMETYFQGGTITGSSDKILQSFTRDGKIQYQDTLDSYNVYIANEPAYFQMNNFPMGTDTKNTQQVIFGTESCISCHFSSSIATGFTENNGIKTPVFGLPTSADFSWLLNQKASFKKTN